MTEPTPATLSDVARDAAEELVRELRAEAGTMAPEYAAKARDLADAARVLAIDWATGKIGFAQFGEGLAALKLAARSIAAEAGLDVFGRRRAMADVGVGVLVRMLVRLASGGTLV